MKYLLSTFRILFFLFFAIACLTWIVIGNPFVKNKEVRAHNIRHFFVRVITKVLGIKIKSKGRVTEPVFVMISNHRTYLDPVIALHDVKAHPVAKAEVSNWPLIGIGASASGVIWVKRESRASRHRTFLAIGEALANKLSVLIYPEGTTYDTPLTGEFRLGAFRVAAEEGYPVIPSAIDYPDPDVYWVGDATFVPHLFKTFTKRKTEVTIHYGEPIWSNDSKELMKKTQAWIDEELNDIREEFERDKK